MKKTFVGLALTFIFALLTGCASAPNQPTLEQTYGVGVVTQTREVTSYGVAPQAIQQGKIIPYTYIGQPNVVHYLDTTNMPPVQSSGYTVPQNNYYTNSSSNYGNNSYNYGNNNNNNRNTTTYTFDQYGNRVVNSNYSNGSYNYNNNNYNYNANNSGVAYVPPTTQSPGYGYEWRYNNRYGWAWYHPQYGWYLATR